MKRLFLPVLCLAIMLQSIGGTVVRADELSAPVEDAAAEAAAESLPVSADSAQAAILAAEAEPSMTIRSPKTVYYANNCNTAGEYGFSGADNINAVKGYNTEMGSVMSLSALGSGAFGMVTYETGSVTDIWDGTSRDTTWYGDGTAEVYEIASASALAGLAKLVSEGNSMDGKRFLLQCSVDLADREWMPIGGSSTKFKGTFDGCGNEIRNLKITKSYGGGNLGVFGYVEGTLLRLGVDGADVSVSSTSNGKITMAALAGSMTGTIENCYARNTSLCLLRAEDKETSRVLDLIAPVVGSLGKGTLMRGCYSVNQYIYSSWGALTGGIFGLSFGESSAKTTVSNCYTGGSCLIETNPLTGNPVRYYPMGAKNTSANTNGSKNMCGHTTALFKGDKETYGNVYTELAAGTVSGEELKQSAASLGDAYKADFYYVNDGFPALISQRTPIDSTLDISFDVNVPGDAGAELVLYSGKEEAAVVDLGAYASDAWASLTIAAKDGKYRILSDDTLQGEESLSGGNQTVSAFAFRVWGSDVLFDNIMIYRDDSALLTRKAEEIKVQILSQALNFPLLTDHLALPDGDNGSTITWKSENTDLLSDTGSIVARKSCSVPVVLTAEIMLPYPNENYAAASAALSFPFRIAPNDGAGAEETVSDILDTLLGSTCVTDEPWDKISKNLRALPAEWDGASIAWSTSDADVMESDGTVHITESGEKSVTLSATVTLGSVSERRDLTFTVLSADTILREAADAVTYATLTGEEWQKITKDLTLPTEGLYGTTITWRSDCPSLLTDKGYVMEIPDDTAVTLTAQFAKAGYTRDKEFPFVVRLSASKKIAADIAEVQLPREAAEDFSVPLSGAAYASEITWSSQSPYLEAEGEKIRVTRPENENGNADAVLTASFVNDGTTVNREYTVTVLCLPADDVLLQETLDGIRFSDISYETDLSAIKQDLHFINGFRYGIQAVWRSDKPDVVSDDGKVTRPAIGSANEAVMLTLTLTRGTAVKSKGFRFTVAAYGTPDEILHAAAEQLTFRTLSTEPIDLVSEDLFLPKAWNYGTEISWRSDSALIAVKESEDGNYLGQITRPAFGAENKPVKLTAILHYQGMTLEKEFSVIVAESNGNVAVVYEDFDSFAPGEIFTESVDGKITHRNKNQITTIAADPADRKNPVMKIEKTTDLPWVSSGTDATINSLIPTLSRSGDFRVEFRLLIEEMSNLRFRLTMPFVGEGLEEIDIFIEADGAIYQKNTGNKAQRKLNIGTWNDLAIVFSTYSNTLDIYLDDTCILKGAPFAYNTGSTEVSALKMKFVPPVGSADGAARETHTVYVDNLSILRMVDYASEMAEAMKQLELQFLAAQNINAITKDIVIPDLSKYAVTVSAVSSNPQVVASDGTVHRGNTDQEVSYTVTLTNEYGGTRSRTFKLLVKKANYISDDEGGTTDQAIAVLYDAKQAIKLLESSYNLGYITGNLRLPTGGVNGSTLSWKSTNPAVLADDGTVTRQSADTKLTLYLTATLGGVSERIETELTIKAAVGNNMAQGGSGGSGGSGGIGGGISGSGTNLVSPYVPADERGDQTMPERSDGFLDIDGHWAKDAILTLYKMGIVNGISSTEFGTEATVTREEFTAMLVRLLGYEYYGDQAAVFADVQTDDWYYPYVMAAYEEGLVRGISPSQFGAGQNISRQDLCVMLERALQRLGVPSESAEEPFSDEDSISDYAVSAVYALKGCGIVGGKENNVFDPRGMATRAEAAKMIAGVAERMPVQDGRTPGEGE